ncbi:hypothetical protein Q9L58_001449 [Maublancomyces gigas]|uniref:F-box domain-containing protein n=1 Tax=Discina gigas TaxID=1032678 RepID=A0ABR3GU22_9PEZI
MALNTRFPTEITILILSFLPVKDLASASRVSRYLQALSEPLLYREPSLPPAVAEPSSLYIFVRTLLTPGRESLVSHVRTLLVDWDESSSTLPSEPESEIALFTAAESRLGIQNLRASYGAQIVLCLYLLPFLTTLDVMPSFRNHDFEVFIESLHATLPTSLPPGLQSLRVFNWYSDGCEQGVSYAMLLTIMRLPCIRTIDVDIIEELRGPFPDPDSRAISGITNLHFSAAISSTSLTRILTLPRALTHFSFNLTLGYDLNLSHLSTALKPLQRSLQILELGIFDRWSRGEVDGLLTSLREWPVLRSVRIAPVTLLGVENEQGLAQVLPAGLCALGIFSDYISLDTDIAEIVLVMLGQKGKMLPCLRRLALPPCIEANPKLFTEIIVACEKVGVVVVRHSELFVG